MIPHMQLQTEPFGEYTDVDLASLGPAGAQLSIGYSHAAQLSFTLPAAEHTTPLPRLGFVRLWFEGAKLADGETDQDEDHPIFEGFIESVSPGGDANRVAVTCFDPTYRANREITFMSAAYESGIGGGSDCSVWFNPSRRLQCS